MARFFRPQCWILLAFAQTAGDAAAPQYEIDPCAAPAKLTFTGISDFGEEKFDKELETSSTTQREYPVLLANDADPAAADAIWKKMRDRAPYLTLATHEGKIDVRVELRDVPLALIYETKRIAARTKDVALKRIAGEKGPE